MKTKMTNYLKTKIWLPLFAAVLTLHVNQAAAQTPISKWTFEVSSPAGAPGAGNWITNISSELGLFVGTASGKHATAATYSTVTGNGSAKAITVANWSAGDFWQFAVNTVGLSNILVSYDQTSSATGPGQFYLAYSTDGVNFTVVGAKTNTIFTSTSPVAWNATTAQSLFSTNYDLSLITAVANKPVVYFRLIDASTVSSAGGTVASTGTSRVDNFLVSGTISGPPQIVSQPANSTNFFGDNANISVTAGGDAPLSYQWYTNSTPLTPLTDGSSGYGAGTIAGSTASTLALTFLSTNQTGNYRVVVTNNLGAATSAVVHLQVNIRTPIVTNIAYLRKLHDTNFVVIDTTNLYVIEGVVTTPINLVSGVTPVNSFFMQDTNTGVGCDVFFRGGYPMPSLGDHVRVTAPLLQFNGLTEVNPITDNPAHNVEILNSGYPLPSPQYFDISALPTPTNMEELIEGRYLVVSNVFIGVATNVSGHYTAGGTVFMTNQFGKTFNALVPNNPAIDLVGNVASTPFAKSIRGVMSQSQASGTVLTNGYSILIAQGADIEAGSPITANSDAYTISQDTTNTFKPLTNDIVFSPNATPRILSVSAVSTTNGVAAIDNGTNIIFTPDLGYVGTLTIGYTATDDAGFSNTGIIVVTVNTSVAPTPIPLNIQSGNGNQLVLTWTNAVFNLQSSTNVAGPYTNVIGATSPYTNIPSIPTMFFRLKF